MVDCLLELARSNLPPKPDPTIASSLCASMTMSDMSDAQDNSPKQNLSNLSRRRLSQIHSQGPLKVKLRQDETSQKPRLLRRIALTYVF